MRPIGSGRLSVSVALRVNAAFRMRAVTFSLMAHTGTTGVPVAGGPWKGSTCTTTSLIEGI
jgi:hypothetical protein